jgi:hypothetical protein
LDFGLVVAPVDMQKYDYLKLPRSDAFGLLLRKDSPLAKLDAVRPKDIGDTPVWVAHQQLEGNVLSSWLKRDVSTLNVVSTFNLIMTPAMMVERASVRRSPLTSWSERRRTARCASVRWSPRSRRSCISSGKSIRCFRNQQNCFLKKCRGP